MTSKLMRKGFMLLGAMILVFVLAACGNNNAANNTANETPANTPAPANDEPKEEPAADLSGTIKIDGSSTVYPISQAVAEEYMEINKGVTVEVGSSGTGGGFEKFANGELDITGASRPQKDEEKAAATANGVEGVEFKIANDGLTVVIHKDNTWAEDMTVDELKKLWEPAAEGKVMKWSDIRADWPAENINLYGPGTDSGTFDYFTKEIVGEEGASRGDYQPSEDDNVLVQGVSGDQYAMGYFGYAYYIENKDTLKSVKINGIEPNEQTIEDGSYSPLGRPIFIYVKKSELARPEIQEYLKFHFTDGKELVSEVGYIQLKSEMYEENLKIAAAK